MGSRCITEQFDFKSLVINKCNNMDKVFLWHSVVAMCCTAFSRFFSPDENAFLTTVMPNDGHGRVNCLIFNIVIYSAIPIIQQK